MVKYGRIFLLTAIIIIICKNPNCNGNKSVVENDGKINNAIQTHFMQLGDTLFLSIGNYKIISLDKYVLDIEITNHKIASSIKMVKYSIIAIELGSEQKIAKANDLFSSSVPQNCDYFYPLDKGYIVLINNKINFRKIYP